VVAVVLRQKNGSRQQKWFRYRTERPAIFFGSCQKQKSQTLSQRSFWSLSARGAWGVSETRKSMELSERAWASVIGAIISMPPTVGQPLHFNLMIPNTGKEPAVDLNYASDFGVAPTPPNDDFSSLTVRSNKTCEGLQPQDAGGFITPGGGVQRGTDSGRGDHPVLLTDDIVQGRSLLYTQGCIAYRTFGKIHHSSYCFVFSLKPNTPWNASLVSACPNGNTTD
jgi:hypothetical protein